MKRMISASFDEDDEYFDEFDDIPAFDYSSEKVVPAIAERLKVDNKIASIIYEWYDAEDAWEDFDSIPDFLHYLEGDIYNMLDACTDEEEYEMVQNALD